MLSTIKIFIPNNLYYWKNGTACLIGNIHQSQTTISFYIVKAIPTKKASSVLLLPNQIGYISSTIEDYQKNNDKPEMNGFINFLKNPKNENIILHEILINNPMKAGSINEPKSIQIILYDLQQMNYLTKNNNISEICKIYNDDIISLAKTIYDCSVSRESANPITPNKIAAYFQWTKSIVLVLLPISNVISLIFSQTAVARHFSDWNECLFKNSLNG